MESLLSSYDFPSLSLAKLHVEPGPPPLELIGADIVRKKALTLSPSSLINPSVHPSLVCLHTFHRETKLGGLLAVLILRDANELDSGVAHLDCWCLK